MNQNTFFGKKKESLRRKVHQRRRGGWSRAGMAFFVAYSLRLPLMSDVIWRPKIQFTIPGRSTPVR